MPVPALVGIGAILGKIATWVSYILAGAWTIEGLVQIIKRILGVGAVGSAVVSGGASVKQIFDLFRNLDDPQKAVMNYLASALSSIPSFDSLIADIDSKLSWTHPPFTPAVTLSNVLAYTGIGEAINQVIMTSIQGLVFVFSVWVIKWAFSSNFTFTQGPKKP